MLRKDDSKSPLKIRTVHSSAPNPRLPNPEPNAVPPNLLPPKNVFRPSAEFVNAEPPTREPPKLDIARPGETACVFAAKVLWVPPNECHRPSALAEFRKPDEAAAFVTRPALPKECHWPSAMALRTPEERPALPKLRPFRPATDLPPNPEPLYADPP